MNWQHGITAVLVFLLVALLVDYVYYQNKTRKMFAATQKIEKEKLEINAEWARLQIERSTLVANNRIERVAREQLDMKLPDEEQILVITR